MMFNNSYSTPLYCDKRENLNTPEDYLSLACEHSPIINQTIKEHGNLLLKSGEPVGKLAEIRLVDKNDAVIIFEIGSGDYSFVAE